MVVGGSCCSVLFGGTGVAGARAVWRYDGRQDLRAVHDSRGPCSEKCPFLARSSRGVSSDGHLRGISDAWRAYLAKGSPFSDAWRANLAMNWRFSRPRPLLGCMRRKNCHGLTPGNASRKNIATASQAKSASGRSPAAVGRWGTHFANILSSASARERIAREYCHYQSPESAFAKILPWTNAWIRPAPNNCRSPRKKTAPKAELRECLHVRSTKDRVLARLERAAGTARCSAIAEHSGMQRGELPPWPITHPETKEGEHFARLLLLFCLRLEWPSGPSR